MGRAFPTALVSISQPFMHGSLLHVCTASWLRLASSESSVGQATVGALTLPAACAYLSLHALPARMYSAAVAGILRPSTVPLPVLMLLPRRLR